MSHSSPPTVLDIVRARQRLRPHLTPTLLEPAPGLAPQAYLKLENLNIQHSFKIRGAMNAVLAQEAQARQHGVITASAGNHGLGLVYAARLLDIPASVVIPTGAPRRKIEGMQRLGADVILHGQVYEETEAHARQLEQAHGQLFISPYNNRHVIAGQGTIGLELVEQLPDVATVIVPVGGGGLISGVGLALRAIKPGVQIIGVQSEATPAMYNLWHDTNLPQQDSLADGLAGGIEEGSLTIDLCRQVADDIRLYPEDAIAAAIGWMFRAHGWVIEGSAAVAVAALQTGDVAVEEPVAALITGGNIDAGKFLQLMEGQASGG